MSVLLRDPRPPAVALFAEPADVATVAQPPLPLTFGVTPPDCLVAAPDDVDGRAVQATIRLLFEAMAGRRPLAQLEPLTSIEVMRTVAAASRRRLRMTARSLRITTPLPGVLEVCLRVRDPAQPHDTAVALRLDRDGRALVCTALELAPRPCPVSIRRTSAHAVP